MNRLRYQNSTGLIRSVNRFFAWQMWKLIFVVLSLLCLSYIAQERFVGLVFLVSLLQLFLVRSVWEGTKDLHLLSTVMLGQQARVEPVFYLFIQVVLVLKLLGAILVLAPGGCGAQAIGHVELWRWSHGLIIVEWVLIAQVGVQNKALDFTSAWRVGLITKYLRKVMPLISLRAILREIVTVAVVIC